MALRVWAVGCWSHLRKHQCPANSGGYCCPLVQLPTIHRFHRHSPCHSCRSSLGSLHAVRAYHCQNLPHPLNNLLQDSINHSAGWHCFSYFFTLVIWVCLFHCHSVCFPLIQLAQFPTGRVEVYFPSFVADETRQVAYLLLLGAFAERSSDREFAVMIKHYHSLLSSFLASWTTN